jgi:large subunit ribosomal protein L22
MKAVLKNHRQSPRKMRLVASLLRGKGVEQAFNILNIVPKKASLPIKKLVESALANAKNSGEDTSKLYIKEIRVDEGITLKRFQPAWRGMAHPIRKRGSHIEVKLAIKN